MNLPARGTTFVEGPAGAGKTTTAVARLVRMISEGLPAGSVLILTPQRTLASPYTDALRRPATPAGGEAAVLTLGGLAQRMVELFWPMVAGPAGFAQPDRPPISSPWRRRSTIWRGWCGPLLEKGYFDSVVH